MVLRGPSTYSLATVDGSIRFTVQLEERETLHVVALTSSDDAPRAPSLDPELSAWLRQHSALTLRERVLLVLCWLRERGASWVHLNEIRDAFQKGGLPRLHGVAGAVASLVKRGECRRVHNGTYQLTNRADRELDRMRRAAADKAATE